MNKFLRPIINHLNHRGYLSYLRLNSLERKEIKKNSGFKNLYNSQRCFILGNGPSLNQYNLEKLNHEYVFCVNEFVRHKDFDLIAPNFYLLADVKYFELKNGSNSGDKELLDLFEARFTANPNMKLFVPIGSKKTLLEYGWTTNNIHYFCSGGNFNTRLKTNIDFAKVIPSMQAVIQYSILLAVYMGFKKIYLLGTEQTNIFGNLKAFMNSNESSDYAFNMSPELKLWKNKKLTSYSLPETLRGYARIFEIYDLLVSYCKYNNVEIFNCAEETMIQNIPKINFNSII